MNPNSLRKQLSKALVGSLAVLTILGNVLVFAYIKHLDLKEFDALLQEEWRELAAMTVIEPDGRLELEVHHFDLHMFAPPENASYYQLWTNDGKLLAKSPSLENGSLPLHTAPVGESVIQDVSLPDGRDGRAIWATATVRPEHPTQMPPGYAAGDPKHKVTIAYATSREGLDRILALELLSAILIGSLMTACAVFIVHWLTSRAFREVHDLATTMQAIDVDTLSSRVPESNLAQELQPIALQFNEVLARLSKGVEREKRFNANIAHELRTPLTALLSLHELAVEECQEGALEDPGAYSADALQLTQRIQHLIETLSALHDANIEERPLNCVSVSLSELLETSWNECKGTAMERGITCECSSSGDVTILSDSVLCQAVFVNLIDNAVTYSPNGSVILACARSDRDTVTVSISNPPIDLDVADLPNLTEAFWQKDDSRTDTEHSGLGLSLVTAYARLLEAKFEARFTPDGRFEVGIAFPLKP